MNSMGLAERQTNKETMPATSDSILYRTKEEVKVRQAYGGNRKE